MYVASCYTTLTFGTKLVLSARIPLNFEATIALVALTPDPRVVEDTYAVELTAAVDTLHHSRWGWGVGGGEGVEKEREGKAAMRSRERRGW